MGFVVVVILRKNLERSEGIQRRISVVSERSLVANNALGMMVCMHKPAAMTVSSHLKRTNHTFFSGSSSLALIKVAHAADCEPRCLTNSTRTGRHSSAAWTLNDFLYPLINNKRPCQLNWLL